MTAGRGWRLALAVAAALAGPTPASAVDGDVARLIEREEWSAAESALRQRLARGDDAGARDLLGVALSRQGRHAEAEQEFRRALTLAPDSSAARQHLARLHLLTRRGDEALAELRRAAQQGPLERDLALWLADAESEAGRAGEAERQWRSVAERFGSVRALLRLARIETRRGDTRAALDTLRRARELAPNAEDVLAAYGQTALTARAPVAAILAFEPLARLHPGVAAYPYLLGVASLQAGDMPAAVAALEHAWRLEPERALTLVALGLAYNSLKRYDEARPLLAQSLEIEPDLAEARAALAEAEEGRGELAAAEEQAQRALAKDPRNANAHLVLGTLRLKEGRHAEARDALMKAVAANPDSAKAHYQLSLACARLGDTACAARHVELHRKARADLEARLMELRGRTGTAGGGMQP